MAAKKKRSKAKSARASAGSPSGASRPAPLPPYSRPVESLPEPLTEEAPLRPNEGWYYSRAKARVERILEDLQRRHPETIVIRLRSSILLGPGADNSIGHLFTRRLLLRINRELRLNLTWGEDIAEAFYLALHHPHSDTFNLAADGVLNMDEGNGRGL